MLDSGFTAFKQIVPKWYRASILRLLEDNVDKVLEIQRIPQSIPIRDCGTDIRNYLRAAGFADSTLKTEVELLVCRAGIELL